MKKILMYIPSRHSPTQASCKPGRKRHRLHLFLTAEGLPWPCQLPGLFTAANEMHETRNLCSARCRASLACEGQKTWFRVVMPTVNFRSLYTGWGQFSGAANMTGSPVCVGCELSAHGHAGGWLSSHPPAASQRLLLSISSAAKCQNGWFEGRGPEGRSSS